MPIHVSMMRSLAAVLLFLAFLTTAANAARDGSTDRPGLDYRTFELSAPNPDLCESACKREQQCRSWTYSWPGAKGPKAMCALKTGVPPKRSDTCCISGVMSTSSPVTRTDDPKPEPQPAPVGKAEQPAAPVKKPEPAPQTDTASRPEPTRKSDGEGSASKPPRVSVVPKPKPPVPVVRPEDDEPAEQVTSAAPPQEQRPAVSAQEASACRGYADRAVAQNRENRELQCGLSGSRWGFSYDAYYNYCIKSPAADWQAARQARDRDLNACRRSIASRQNNDDDVRLPEVEIDLGDLFNGDVRDRRFCRTFADQSVRQANEARRLDCGFRGQRWSTSRVRQARLCEGIGPRAATQILEARARQLDRCRAEAGVSYPGRGGRDSCDSYAAESVRQARMARELDCGFGGARWTTSYGAHLRWCRQVSFGESASELRARDRLLARCE